MIFMKVDIGLGYSGTEASLLASGASRGREVLQDMNPSPTASHPNIW